LVRVLLGDRWAPIVPIFSWLGVTGILQVLNNTVSWIFVPQGRTRELFHLGIYNVLMAILSFIIGIQWGAVGLAAAYAISDWIVRTPVVWWGVGRVGPIRASDMIRLQAPVTISAVVTFFLFRFWIGGLFAQPGLEIMTSVIVSYSLAAGLLACTSAGRARLTEVYRVVCHLLERVFARSVPQRI